VDHSEGYQGAPSCRRHPVRLHISQDRPPDIYSTSSDFENKFVCGEIMSYQDLKEHGSESAVKAAGKLRQQGKPYESMRCKTFLCFPTDSSIASGRRRHRVLESGKLVSYICIYTMDFTGRDRAEIHRNYFLPDDHVLRKDSRTRSCLEQPRFTGSPGSVVFLSPMHGTSLIFFAAAQNTYRPIAFRR
jgi:hypothetical protein